MYSISCLSILNFILKYKTTALKGGESKDKWIRKENFGSFLNFECLYIVKYTREAKELPREQLNKYYNYSLW